MKGCPLSPHWLSGTSVESEPEDGRDEEPPTSTLRLSSSHRNWEIPGRAGSEAFHGLILPAGPQLGKPRTSVDPLLRMAFLPGSREWAERIK